MSQLTLLQAFRNNLGSCVTNVHRQVGNTHASDQLGLDSFRIDHSFIRCHVEMEVPLVDPTEGTQVGAECRSSPFAGVAMDLALAITIVVPRPFAYPVGHGGISRMAATIALPFVGIEARAARGHVVGHEGVAGLPVRVVADPPGLLARVARDHTDIGGRALA
jgi:hypothetical protein